jgi:hypothetical protein
MRMRGRMLSRGDRSGYTRPGEEAAEEETVTVKAGASHTATAPFVPAVTYAGHEGGDEKQEAWERRDRGEGYRLLSRVSADASGGAG